MRCGRFAPVNSSRSTNERNVDSSQDMRRRTQAQILAADASAFIGQLELGHERVRERDFRERRHRFCRESSGDAKGDVSGVA